ncbi:hypothetical protein CMI46_03220 [Candidatus Pacearchaeota archaeon]|nr:hypothetical protein [Candidatus Pacearchaeota archaeon]|tara:strand:- start:272 stop:1027 length:756 start_codon:yes stop_codon:yes gene_type:complete
MKKTLTILFIFTLFLSLAAAEKISVETIEESYSPNKNITIIVNLHDNSNKPLSDQVNLIFENDAKTNSVEKTINSNTISEIYLGENTPGGFWTIKAAYKKNEATTNFQIETSEEVKFELNGDTLTITNTGNTVYDEEIKIFIRETFTSKKPVIKLGESTSFRLIAPEGVYNIRVSDKNNLLTREGVALTGEVIGILDEKLQGRTPITGINPNANSSGIIKQNPLIYIFVLAVVGAAILLTVERYYRKKAED